MPLIDWHRNFGQLPDRGLAGCFGALFLTAGDLRYGLVIRFLDDKAMPLLEAHQQDLGGVHANLLFETVIETLDADAIVHFQA